MSTASVTAPAAQLRLVGAEDELAERRALAAELYRDGLTERVIAERLGISQSAVQRDLAALGVPKRRRGPQVDELERRRIARRRVGVARRYRAGESIPAIAAGLGCSEYTVWRDLQAEGVERRRSGPPRVHPEPAERPCAHCGAFFLPKGKQVAAAYGETCSHHCKSARRWRTGVGISIEMVENAKRLAPPGWSRRVLGRWRGRKPPGPGARARGRPRAEVSEDGRALIDHLAKIGYGRRSIARATGLTERVVRRHLDANAPQNDQLTL